MGVSLANHSLFSNVIPEDNSRHFLLLLILGAIMLYLRIAPNYAKIFTNWPGEYGNFVNFSADDAVYHMRFVHNTLQHFPARVFFDPFTHFPFGSYIAFGPLFTLIIAGVALIAGLGHPTPELINHVAAYIPPVMGALCLIPLYFIARKLFGKTTAILAAFVLTFLPGEFLNRSALGFVDHHIAEVLFATTTCAFLIYALNAAQSLKFSFANIKNNLPTLIYGLFAGITFGLFILIWQGALMFGAIFLIFFITQLTIDHMRNNNTAYLLSLASLIYIPPTLMVLPYTLSTSLTQYPANNILILAAILVIFIVCYLLHIALKYNQAAKNFYPLALAAMFVLIVLALSRWFPQIYALMHSGCKLLFQPTPEMQTISEVHPTIIGYDNKITTALFWHKLFWTMPLAITGLGCLTYCICQNQAPTKIFLLVWTLTITAAACAQIRFNYYLAINAALLAGYAIYSLLHLIDSCNPQKKLYIKLKKLSFFTLFFAFAILIIDPMIMLLMDHNIPSGAQVNREWYNTLIWLKKHTPNPQGKANNKNFDYTSGYYPIPKDLNTRYNYPKSAYGIMSWWDTGHQITYIAERIPNATPFQLGIIEDNGKAGAARFFTSTNEKKAVRNLDTVGTRYIIINNSMPSQLKSIGIWCNDTKNWDEITNIKIQLPKKIIQLQVPVDSPKFSRSILNRLFYNDANGSQHFRLIYESDGDYHVRARQTLLKNGNISVNSSEWLFKNHKKAFNTTKKINRILINKEQTVFTYSAHPPVKGIKIFEKVKGATINGNAPNNTPDNTPVKLQLKLKTKYGRIFTYKQTTKIKSGKYKVIVPYPTTKMRGNDYDYDIQPIGTYQIQINNQLIKVAVPESAVMLGKNIKAR